MSGSSPAARVEAAKAVLARAGLPRCRVTAAAEDAGVLIIAARQQDELRLRELSGGTLLTQLEEVGFRYVALDLTAGEEQP